MSKLTTALAPIVKPQFWIDAGTIIAGYKVSDLASVYIGPRVPIKALQPFAGPVLVIAGSTLLRGKLGGIGRNLRIGAFVYAADKLLDMAGLPSLG